MHYISRIAAGIAGLMVASIPLAQAGHTNNVLITNLDGREEVDNDNPGRRHVGDPNGRGIGYVFGIDNDPMTLCYVLTVEKIQLVPVGEGMAAHIHEGARDTNGPVVAALAGPEDGNAADCLTEGEQGKFPTGEAGIVQRILNNPSDFYINVHNPDYPGGAIRGQLRYQLDDLHEHDHEHGEDGMGVPSMPMNLSASVYSATAAEIFWDRSMDSDGLVIGYQVYVDGALMATVEGNSYFVEGLNPGSSYAFSVEAIDMNGNVSARSNEIVVQTGS